MLQTNLTAQAIDDALAETFPASDPPAWTAGIARLAPETRRSISAQDTTDEANGLPRADVIELSPSPQGKLTLAPAR